MRRLGNEFLQRTRDFFQFVYPWLWVAISISVMIALNGIMWTFYTKALHERGGTLVATVVSSGANYCFSALLGSFVFGETTTVIWWLGMALVVLGLFTVNYDQSRMKKEE